MAFTPKQVPLTAAAQSLTTLLGLSEGKHFFSFDVILAEGETAIGYGGPSTVTNAPANAAFKFTASLGYSSPTLGSYMPGHTDKVFLVVTANAVAHLAVWE